MLLLAPDAQTEMRVRTAWLAFDVQCCDCFRAEDRDRIVAVIDRFPSGALGFNEYIRDLARRVLHEDWITVSVNVNDLCLGMVRIVAV